MNATKILMVLALCVLLCVMIGLVVDQAYAQKGLGIAGRGGDLTGDRDLASKKGMDVIMSSHKKVDASKMPGKLEKMVGIGSIFVMIAVVKWL